MQTKYKITKNNRAIVQKIVQKCLLPEAIQTRQTTMSQIALFAENNKKILQTCLLAKDPLAHLQSLPPSFEKRLLLFLSSPHSQDYREQLKQKYSIEHSLADEITRWKIQSKISSAQNINEIKYLIQQILQLDQEKFHYPKPAEFQTATDQRKLESSSLPSKLKPILSLNEWAKEQLKKSQGNIKYFTKNAIQSLGQQTLMKLKPSNKQTLLNIQHLLRGFSDSFVAKFVKVFYEQMLQSKKNYLIPSSIYHNLTKSQFFLLKDEIEGLVNQNQYLNAWISYNYDEQLQKYLGKNLTISEKDEKRKMLLNVFHKLTQLKTVKTKPTQKKVLRQILLLDIQRQQVDKDLFLQYYKDNTASTPYENQRKKFKKKNYGFNDDMCYDDMCYDDTNQDLSPQEKLVQDTISRLFKKEDAENTLKQLQNYFQTVWLNKLFAITKLSEGAKVQDYSKYLPINQLNQLKQKKQITIIDKDNKIWKTQDQILLQVRVKNVSNIHVKIYKLNLQKHYIQNRTEIDQIMDLSYLQPTHSYEYKTQNQNPYLIEAYEIKVDGIQKERGIWIVDLEGQGISSRAFIRKGAITSVTSTNTAGTKLKFYDESGSQIKNYKIWMQGKYHQVESFFVIPFGQTTKQLSLVVSKDGYSEKLNVSVPAESYSLNISYLYNNESFIVGSIAKVLLHPCLTLEFNRNMQVSFKLLQKLRIMVTLTNNLGIKSTIDVQNIQFKQNEDYVLQFPIQSYTTNIDISVSAKISKYNKKQQILTNSHSIAISLGQDQINFIDLYMKMKNQEYFMFILGKNGQPISRTQLTIRYLAKGRNKEQTQLLMSETDGSVNLGALTDVISINASVNLKAGTLSRIWKLQQFDQQVQYATNTVFHQNESIEFLRLPNEQVHLWKLTDVGDLYSQNLTTKIETKVSDNKISIKELTIGRYSIEFQTSGARVDFTVVEGKKWENQNKIFDQKKSVLYEVDPHQNEYISLSKAQFKKEGQFLIVQISLTGTYDFQKDPSLRGHLLVSNFILPNFNGKLNFTSGLLRSKRESKLQVFNTKKSEYYNNKQLAEQISYTINRQNEKKYVGNDLQKPQIFLKRAEVGDTTQIVESLATEKHYSLSNALCNNQVLESGRNYANKSYNRKAVGGGVYGSRFYHSAKTTIKNAVGTSQFQFISKSSTKLLLKSENLSSYNNFLVLHGTILSNKKGETLVFKVPLGYSHFQCFVFTKSISISKKYNYPIQNVKIKNLSHNGIQEGQKGTAWTMSRQVYKATKGQTIKVGRDSVWSAIGLTNIVNLAKIKGANLQDWVINWSKYSKQQKYKTYDQKVCHQLNTYIKFNDPTFFEDKVRPFISNKLTKTFVDLCLLDHQSVLQYTDINLFKTLNQFEKVLLVQQLVKNNKLKQAQNIVNSMENVNKSKRITSEQFKKQFDTVISVKLADPASQPTNIDKSTEQQQIIAPIQSTIQNIIASENNLFLNNNNNNNNNFQNVRSRYAQPFKQIEPTKQYTQTTYSKLTQPHKSTTLINPSPFWTSIAKHFISSTGDFLSENFMYLTKSVQFTLATCFIPNRKLLQYGLNTQDNHVIIQPTSSFLIFVKQIKSFAFQKKFGVLINQRFFNPDDRYSYEQDGTPIEKQTQQFVISIPYCIQTLITNTSGTKLQLQLLIDIPKGSLPLKSHEATQIQSINLLPYSTLSFQRYFYFPKPGNFTLYPANASRGNTVISKADPINKITVLEVETIKKMDTLQNILKSGEKDGILHYLQTKNIFDQKIFNAQFIMWMLKDKQFYQKVLSVMRTRKFYSQDIWLFGYYHNDLKTIKQHQQIFISTNIHPENNHSNLAAFEYFPYYSRRAHKFLNENKSTIRNSQFKKTYFTFLFTCLFNQPTSSRARITFIYFLLLQDRIDQANELLSNIEQKQKDQHRMQFDYIECFIDMFRGYPSFTKARKIVGKYIDYPVKSWRQLFTSISNTLKQYDSDETAVLQTKVQFKTTVQKGQNLKITIPPQTSVDVNIFNINLELYYSSFPFSDPKTFQFNTIPNFTQTFQASASSRDETITRTNKMKNCFVQIYQSTSGLKQKKVDSFLWNNPNLQIKIKQETGEAQVFLQNKRKPGCYCKVFQNKNGEVKFCRDGYTDITGTFKYALTDLKGVTEFAILFVTDIGSTIERVRPPLQQGFFK